MKVLSAAAVVALATAVPAFAQPVVTVFESADLPLGGPVIYSASNSGDTAYFHGIIAHAGVPFRRYEYFFWEWRRSTGALRQVAYSNDVPIGFYHVSPSGEHAVTFSVFEFGHVWNSSDGNAEDYEGREFPRLFSADDQMFVRGKADGAGGHPLEAVRGATVTPMPDNAFAEFAAYDITDDGSKVAGTAITASGETSPFIWTVGGDLTILSNPASGFNWKVVKILEDGGAIVAGPAGSSTPVYRWSPVGGYQLIGGFRSSDAFPATIDSGNANVPAWDRWGRLGLELNQPRVWTRNGGFQTARSYLASRGVDVDALGQTIAIGGLRDDGRVMWGTARPSSGDSYYRRWIITGLAVNCATDFNGDGFVDFFDYDGYVLAFESGDSAADVNFDGFLDFFDYDEFVQQFEAGC